MPASFLVMGFMLPNNKNYVFKSFLTWIVLQFY